MKLTDKELAVLERPHVGISVFVEAEFPDGIRRYHDGVGTVTLSDREWNGVTDVFGNRAAVMTEIDHPTFGTAPAYVFAIVGCDVAFMKYMRAQADNIEGKPAKIFFAAFDQETLEVGIPLKCLVRGKITSAKPFWQGIGVRTVIITIESLWQSNNFPFGRIFSYAGQQRVVPGDKGGEWIGIKVTEQLK